LRRERRFPALAVVALAAFASGGCTALDNLLASVPIFAFLREAPFFDPYEAPRQPPPNAVPFASPGGPPEPAVQPTQVSLLAFAASRYGQNPLQPGEAVALGQVMYDRYCFVCHGAQGEGNGPVTGAGKLNPAPAIRTGPAVGYPDGYIYALIKAGRTLMPAYGGRTTPHERWAIVNYLRQLQASAGAAPAAPGGAAAADTTGQR
jgi:mono/diheme cytochrome c family protein